MVADPSPRRLSVEDYLEYERTAQTRNEFYDGVLNNIAGASPDHNRIAMDTVAALGPRLR